MRARISLSGKLSKKQQEAARELVKEQFHNEAQEHTRRLLKIVCIALNETEGFGKQRIGRFIETVNHIADEHTEDEIFWTHVDKRLEQMNIPFVPENYMDVDR